MPGFTSNISNHLFWRTPLAVLETTMGSITVEILYRHAPIVCLKFMKLARRGYYNNTRFNRVIRDLMVQGGDPTGAGSNGRTIYSPRSGMNITHNLKHTEPGIISMANAGRSTNMSEFLITLGPTQWLDSSRTVFARVHSGMSVVERIGSVECDRYDHPIDEVKIKSVYILE